MCFLHITRFRRSLQLVAFLSVLSSNQIPVTQSLGVRLEETKKINQSLSALGNCICALTDPKRRQHIPYRDSKLTRILEDRSVNVVVAHPSAS